jgi:hypothetical protein
VAVEAPTPSVLTVAEVVDRNVGGLECCIAAVLGNNDSGVPKSNNVASPGASNVGQVADVLINPPSPGAVGEILEDELGGTGEGVVAVVERDQDAVLSESNDVVGSVTGDVADKTDVFVDAPIPRVFVVAEVFDGGEGLNVEAVTEDDDSVQPEAYDIGISRLSRWELGERVSTSTITTSGGGRTGSVLGDHFGGHVCVAEIKSIERRKGF